MNARLAQISVENLIGVSNEKEPVLGTTPERRLLDKSLHINVCIENKILLLHKNI